MLGIVDMANEIEEETDAEADRETFGASASMAIPTRRTGQWMFIVNRIVFFLLLALLSLLIMLANNVASIAVN